MSKKFRDFLGGLFGREEFSDCVVVFYCRNEGSAATPDAAKERDGKEQHEGISQSNRTLTDTTGRPEEPLQVTGLERQDGVDQSTGGQVLPDGRESLSRHNDEPPGGSQADNEPSAKRPSTAANEVWLSDVAAMDVPVGDPLPAHLMVLCGGSPRFSAQASRWTQEQPPGSKPVLRVPLGDPGELPYALSAVRFIYTGQLDVSGAAALLQLWRLSSYLQVEGCVEACDGAMLAAISLKQDAAAGAGPLAGVTELYSSRHLLPDAAEERSAVQALLGACRQQLVSHGAEYGKKGVQAGGTSDAAPSLGDLLAWAFEDAPSLLSDPEVRRQMEALPAEAMEALLGSDSFPTDNEATVLLMLAMWLEVNNATTDDVRKRLCKLIRLSQLNNMYLHCVLPDLSWFPISTDDYRFVSASAGANVSGTHDCKSAPWYSLKARPTPSSGSTRSYEWYIPKAYLQAQLAKQAPCTFLNSQQRNGITRLVANGFEWDVGIGYKKGKGSAGVFFRCQLPASLRSGRAGYPLAVVNPGPARVEVYKWREDGTREMAWGMSYDDDYVRVNGGRGVRDALPLKGVAAVANADQEGAGAAASSPDPLAAWTAYLHNREISGVVTWTQP